MKDTAETDLLSVATALAHPLRLQVVATLARRGVLHVSELARAVGISRPLLHMHLKKLETAKLVTSKAALASDGKGVKLCELSDFDIAITPASVTAAAAVVAAKQTTEKSAR